MHHHFCLFRHPKHFFGIPALYVRFLCRYKAYRALQSYGKMRESAVYNPPFVMFFYTFFVVFPSSDFALCSLPFRYVPVCSHLPYHHYRACLVYKRDKSSSLASPDEYQKTPKSPTFSFMILHFYYGKCKENAMNNALKQPCSRFYPAPILHHYLHPTPYPSPEIVRKYRKFQVLV